MADSRSYIAFLRLYHLKVFSKRNKIDFTIMDTISTFPYPAITPPSRGSAFSQERAIPMSQTNALRSQPVIKKSELGYVKVIF